MAGQVVDVTGLSVTYEASEGMGGDENPNILGIGEAFNLTIAFEGSGTTWANLCRHTYGFVVRYFAEGFGSVPDIDLGEVSGTLGDGTLTPPLAYGFDDDRTTLELPDGIEPTLGHEEALYKLVAVLTIPHWPGVLGYTEGPIIQISAVEQP
jgi:hypothetical protein